MSTLTLPADGPVIATEDDVRDIIGQTFGTDVDTVVIPTTRLAPAFFRLSSGLAGAMLQKFTNYRMAVIIVGDIAAHLENSVALRDFVRESNRRGAIRFLDALPPA